MGGAQPFAVSIALQDFTGLTELAELAELGKPCRPQFGRGIASSHETLAALARDFSGLLIF